VENAVDCNQMEIDPNITYVVKVSILDKYLCEDEENLVDLNSPKIAIYRGSDVENGVLAVKGYDLEIVPFCEF